MNSFWECERLFFEDLPTVRDLIWSADWEILSREVSELREPKNCFSEPEDDEWSQMTRAALEEMMGLDVREPSDKWVFFPLEYYSAAQPFSEIGRSVDATLLRRNDFKAFNELASLEKPCITKRDCEKSVKRCGKRVKGGYPDLYAWSLKPWDKVLSFRVWMQGDYSRKERYQVLASVVSEMLVYGETWEDARAEQRIMKRRLRNDSKAIKKGKTKANPVELLLRNFGLESTTDDYKSEYETRLDHIAMILNYNAAVDLHRRVADLVHRSELAEEQNFRMKVRMIDS